LRWSFSADCGRSRDVRDETAQCQQLLGGQDSMREGSCTDAFVALGLTGGDRGLRVVATGPNISTEYSLRFGLLVNFNLRGRRMAAHVLLGPCWKRAEQGRPPDHDLMIGPSRHRWRA